MFNSYEMELYSVYTVITFSRSPINFRFLYMVLCSFDCLFVFQGGQRILYAVLFTPFPPAIMVMFGSYLSSLYPQLTLYRGCGLAYPYDWRGFVRVKKKTSLDLLVLYTSTLWFFPTWCTRVLFLCCRG